ncbi:hypothetical protein ACLB2K_065068 [Fragaria x ananassa]
MQHGFSNEFQTSPYSFHDYWTQASFHQISAKLNHYDEMIKSLNEMNEGLVASNKAQIEEQEAFNDTWAETKRSLNTLLTLISQEQPYLLMTTSHELPTTSASCQPHDAIFYDSMFFEDEETYLGESYEEPRNVETYEDCLKEESYTTSDSNFLQSTPNNLNILQLISNNPISTEIDEGKEEAAGEMCTESADEMRAEFAGEMGGESTGKMGAESSGEMAQSPIARWARSPIEEEN